MNYKILSTLFLLATASVSAQSNSSTRMSEPFDAPVGQLPEHWEVRMRGEGEAYIAEIPNKQGRAGLLLRRSEDKPGNAVAYFTGAPEMSDFSGVVNFLYVQPLKSVLSTRGVVIRAQKLQYDHFSGYYLCLAPRGEQRSLAIYYNPKSHLEPGELLAEMPIPANLTALRDYQLRFEARGKLIRGELWEANATAESGGKIAEVEIQDADDTPGYFGLRGSYGNKKVSTWFYSLHLETP